MARKVATSRKGGHLPQIGEARAVAPGGPGAPQVARLKDEEKVRPHAINLTEVTVDDEKAMEMLQMRLLGRGAAGGGAGAEADDRRSRLLGRSAAAPT